MVRGQGRVKGRVGYTASLGIRTQRNQLLRTPKVEENGLLLLNRNSRTATLLLRFRNYSMVWLKASHPPLVFKNQDQSRSQSHNALCLDRPSVDDCRSARLKDDPTCPLC
mmetsp:Transcript_30395/g.47614  ORF Transcript_30395/g.47614 Transcript_30395/m.47614 type:complete len:110 (+) Transcript_30395:527-856(+)